MFCGGGATICHFLCCDYVNIFQYIMDEIIFENIISVENLLLAWKEFIKGKRHRKDVQEFEFRLMDNIIFLHNANTKTPTRNELHPKKWTAKMLFTFFNLAKFKV